MSIFKKSVLVMLAFFSFASQANAIVIPPAIGSTGVFQSGSGVPNGLVAGIGNAVDLAQQGVPASAQWSTVYDNGSSTISGTPVPFISAIANSYVNNVEIGAITQELYHVEVVGTPNTNVPVYIGGILSSSNSSSAAPDAAAYISLLHENITSFSPPANVQMGIPLFNAGVCSGSGCYLAPGTPTNLTFNQRVLVPSDTVLSVYMFAEATALLGREKAIADPYFYIDPTFTNASQYTLAFSNGIGNSPLSATPLPASLPMFGAAIIGLGALSLRRKRLEATA